MKDVPNSPLEMLKLREKDSIRLGLYPNVDYKGLYNAISQLVEVATLIQFGLQGTTIFNYYFDLCLKHSFIFFNSIWKCNASNPWMSSSVFGP